jgi:hypothetical protein
VALHVFNSQSQLITTLVEGQREAGKYSATWNTTGLLDGIYFVSVETNGNVMQTLKVVVDR